MDNPRLPTTWYEDHNILMPGQPNKDEKSRIGSFIDWLAWTGRSWISPDLRAYRDYLLHERTKIDPPTGATVSATLAPRTVVAHLSTIRGRYDALLRDNKVRDSLYAFARQNASPADKKAFVVSSFTPVNSDRVATVSFVQSFWLWH